MNEIPNNNFTYIKKKAAWISLIVGSLIFFGKLIAYFLTFSAAIFADASESIVNIIASSMALYSIYLGSKPPDKTHLYGHGNIEYFSAGIEGLMIIIAAIAIFYSSIAKMISGIQPEQLGIGTIIIAATGIINWFLGRYLNKMGKETDSIALVADGKHVSTDSFTSFGIVLGLILVLLTDIYILDPIIAMLVSINILYSGFKLIRQSIGGLMLETDKELLNKIVKQLIDLRKSYWIDIHELRLLRSAERAFVDFHFILPFYFTIKQSHNEETEIEETLQKISPNLELKLHIDYCDFRLCKICFYESCTIREENYSRTISWDEDKLLGPPPEERRED